MRGTREIDRAVKAYRKCVQDAHTVSVVEEECRDGSDWLG